MAVSWMIVTGGLQVVSHTLRDTEAPASLGRSLMFCLPRTVCTARSWRNTISFSTTNTRGFLPRPLVVVVWISTSTDSFFFFSVGCFGMVPVSSLLVMGTSGTRTPPSSPLPSTDLVVQIESYNSPSRGSRSSGGQGTSA